MKKDKKPYEYAKAGDMNGLIRCVQKRLQVEENDNDFKDEINDVKDKAIPYIDRADAHNMSALMWACARGNPEMVKFLLTKGAIVGQLKDDNWTALMCAALRNHDNCVQLLVEKLTGEEVNQTDSDGKTALMCAAVMDFTVVDEDYQTEMKAKNVKVIDYLLEARASIDQKDNLETTALTWACVKSNVGAVRILIAHDPAPDLDAKNVDDLTSLMWACQTGCLEIATMLVEAKADVNATDSDGWTPLMWAAKLLEPDGLEALAYDATDEERQEHALELKLQEEEAELMNSNARDCMSMLLEHGADIDHQDKASKTALMWSAETANIKSAILLLQQGANLDIRDDQGQNALTLAFDSNTFKVLAAVQEEQKTSSYPCEMCSIC